MRRYQRGAIVTFLGFLSSAFVKTFGARSAQRNTGGWVQVFPPNFEKED